MAGMPKRRAARDTTKIRKGARVQTRYRGVDVRGRIHLIVKDGFAVVILDDDDAETVMADAVEVPVAKVSLL